MKSDTTNIDAFDLNLARRNTVGDALTRTAEKSPTTIAVIDGQRRIPYAQLDHDAEAIARGLLDLPQAPGQGDPVAVIVANSYEFLPIYFGIAKAGRVVLPINYGLSADDIAWILTDSGARTTFVDEAMLPLVEAAENLGANLDTVIVRTTKAPVPDSAEAGGPEPRADQSAGQSAGQPAGRSRYDLSELFAAEVGQELRILIGSDDVVQCLYTSGTTGRPKGALSTHSSVVTGVMSNAMLLGEGWAQSPGTMIVCLPMFHVTGLNTLAKPVLFMGGTLIVHNGFSPSAVLDAMEREEVTSFTGLPMMWAALVAEQERQPRDLSSVDTAMYAMAQMPERVLDGMDAMMPKARKVLGSGQTEVVPATTFQRDEHRHGKNGSWGVSSPTVRTRIMDPGGQLLPAGEIGEIVYRGPHVTAGYWNRPEANEEAFRHGWFHSGDIGYMDDEGVIWFADRVKDVIKTGGENVSSMKVERIVADAPGVVECCVIGTEHAHWGEAVTAVVLSDKVPSLDETTPEARAQAAAEAEAAILEYARERLSGFEAPKRVEFIAALPKTTTGKIRKNVLRDLF